MENSTFNIAMDLSNGLFAHHLYGVLKVMHLNGDLTPSIDEEAASYLDTFHAGWREDQEPEEDWDDESAFASAGFGMDESYNDGGAYREDFGYFGEMGMMED